MTLILRKKNFAPKKCLRIEERFVRDNTPGRHLPSPVIEPYRLPAGIFRADDVIFKGIADKYGLAAVQTQFTFYVTECFYVRFGTADFFRNKHILFRNPLGEAKLVDFFPLMFGRSVCEHPEKKVSFRQLFKKFGHFRKSTIFFSVFLLIAFLKDGLRDVLAKIGTGLGNPVKIMFQKSNVAGLQSFKRHFSMPAARRVQLGNRNPPGAASGKAAANALLKGSIGSYSVSSTSKSTASIMSMIPHIRLLDRLARCLLMAEHWSDRALLHQS